MTADPADAARPAGHEDAGRSTPAAVGGPSDWPVFVRPERLRRRCAVVMVVVFLGFCLAGALLPKATEGFTFGPGDRTSFFLIGLLAGAAFWLPTRPRVRADAEVVEVRGIVGHYKTVPWTLVRAVEFRPSWQWARLALPGDESISLYAVQRADAASTVAAMRALRHLHETALDEAALAESARQATARRGALRRTAPGQLPGPGPARRP